MVISEEVNYIIDDLSRLTISTHELQELKQTFRDEIKSARSLERCRSVRDIIRLLQKRDVLWNDESTDHLKTIATILHRRDLLDRIMAPVNRSNANPIIQVIPNMQWELYNKITDVIGRDIGYKWKEFARKLNVREGQIQNLESKYRDIPDRVREMLDIYRDSCPRHTFRSGLLEALRDARRKDLSRDIETIINNANLPYDVLF